MAPNAMTEALNSFFGTPAKTAKPTPPPEPIVVEKASPPKSQPFSFFQAAAPKPAPQAVPKPSPVPARKSPTLTLKAQAIEKKLPVKPAPAFSFFKQASPPEPAPAVPSPVPVRKPSPTLSLFKAKETPPPKPPVVAEAKKSVQGSGTFSLFGGGPKAVAPAPKAPVAVEEKKVVQRSGTFSLFSAPGTRTIAKAPAVEKKAVAPKGTIAIAPPKKAAPVVPDNIPVIGKFKQNADGSITGIVRNSKTFRTGTEITTSPVPRGAKAGTVVKTSSGSKYRLE